MSRIRRPPLRIKLWHICHRASTSVNTIEPLGDALRPRPPHTLAEAIEVCIPAPSRDADQTRIAVRGRLDQHWQVLDTTLEDGRLCAETTRGAWLTIVEAPED
ncbi:MAG: hypothetical protein F4Y29_04065 [Chloroflexi bacterium]|nr:hypothetical protein [Chloroflexota bacterium]